ncbi:sensor histidine kinase [Sphingomonas cavernae]|uniref:Signal transduction histidine kinase internal region domain-containing protein n=1 Tax=Sphingomonas cavernae TaxID=2320861 RepID=A0A418WL56_9SPHN|nr:histidine kinase [Sphingomonas cavernae]RJF90766.1 hypothetical protein D3876_11255 [Sphingomonas cavernae]
MLDHRLNLAPPTRREAALLTVVLWIAVLSVVSLAALLTGQVQSLPEALSLFTGFVTALCFAPILYGVVHLVSSRPLWLAVPVIFAGLTTTAVLQMLGDYGGQYLLHLSFADHRMPESTPQAMMVTTVIYWALSACNMGLLWISAASRRIRVKETELARSQVATLQAQLSLLRMQLNPHFMCNSLNTVSSLILDSQHAEANRMVERLADFLRGVMDIDGDEIRLSDELKTIDSYIHVEATRFGSRLHVAIDAADEVMDAAVPNFILQPLVENALKYGVEPVPGPVSLCVKARRDARELVLTVENESQQTLATQALTGVSPGHGIGLNNTRARLQMLFGDRGTLETQRLDRGFRATIRIPFNALAPAQDCKTAGRGDMAMQQ